MKYLNKNTLISFALGLLLSAGLVYAAQNITTLLQTAAPGDKVTSTWVNAVNTKLGTVDAAGGVYQISCMGMGTIGYALCVRMNTTTGVTETKYTSDIGGSWSVRTTPW